MTDERIKELWDLAEETGWVDIIHEVLDALIESQAQLNQVDWITGEDYRTLDYKKWVDARRKELGL